MLKHVFWRIFIGKIATVECVHHGEKSTATMQHQIAQVHKAIQRPHLSHWAHRLWYKTTTMSLLGISATLGTVYKIVVEEGCDLNGFWRCNLGIIALLCSTEYKKKN